MADQERAGRLGYLVERSGPGVEVNPRALVHQPQPIVELADRQAGIIRVQPAKQLGQWTIAQRPSVVPGGQVHRDGVVLRVMLEQIGESVGGESAEVADRLAVPLPANDAQQAVILAAAYRL